MMYDMVIIVNNNVYLTVPKQVEIKIVIIKKCE